MLTHTFENARNPARVVILGANGFVTRALDEAFRADGVSTLAVGRSTVDLLSSDASDRLSALLSPEDVVVMAAALTPEKGRDIGTLIKNLRMAEALSAAVETRACAHMIYISSDAVYGFADPVISERTLPAPSDLYGIMHLAREIALRETAAKAGIPFCVLRSCAIYGFGDTHNSYGPNRFIRSALERGVIQVFGAGEEIRDHVFIGDVVSVIQMVVRYRSKGLMNLVGGQPFSFAELAQMIARLCDKTVAIEMVPRNGDVRHRSFDPSESQASFPALPRTLTASGITLTLKMVRQAFPGKLR